MPKARIERYHGEPAIVVDGVPYPPMTFTELRREHDYLTRVGETGIRIYFLEEAMKWNRPGNENTPDGTAKTLLDMEKLLAAVPDAYVMLRLQVSPNAAWINAHPSEQVLFSDGSREPVWCYSVGSKVDGYISFASKLWRQEARVALQEYFAALEKSPLAERIIGVFLNAGGACEWFYPGEHRMCNEEKGTYADFSEPFRAAYETWLRKKYGTEEALRKAWKRPDATFEKPLIPDLHARAHVRDFDRVIHAEMARKKPPKDSLARLKAEENAPAVNHGVFLNVDDYLYTADFFAALHEATADTIIFFADVIKQHNPDLLVGAFYGYYGCTDYYESSHCTGTLSILNSGKLDFLSGPGVYNNREPGGVTAQREMQDSMRIRDQMYICEDDMRSHLLPQGFEKWFSGLYSVRDSVNVLKRDFARNICEEIQGWWFDMSEQGTPWYDDPDILSLFRRQQEIAQYAYRLDRTKKHEIAVLYDTESVHMVSDTLDRLVLDFYRTSDLHRIGAPIDYYFHNDVSMEQMPDYKMYIVLNCYCLTAAEREAICAKARRNSALVLWLYAPGFIDPNTEPRMELSNIEKTVGMKLQAREGLSHPFFFAEQTGHPALRYADPCRRYGYIDRQVISNVWVSPSMLPAPYLQPAFYIEDETATVLGRFCADGKAALAMKEADGYTSVYCAAPVLRSELLASLAEYAGCHLYTHSDDVLYASENFVALHAASTGVKRIYFKSKCSPYEVYEKTSYGSGVDHIDVEMYTGETKFWSLHGAW